MDNLIKNKKKCGRHPLAENNKKQKISVAIEGNYKKQLERDIEDGKIKSISSLLHDLIVNYYKKGGVID